MAKAMGIAAALAAAVLTMGAQAMAKAEQQVGHGAPWFQGTIDEAFQTAKAAKKPMLLYWGAVWCPPCNELKSQVLSQPRFAELMRPMVAAYLDGDSETAQIWGERLKISGYPTLLVFDAAGREAMRVSTALSMPEFEAALTSALATGATTREALTRALEGKATPDDWRQLAYDSWETADVAGAALSPAELLDARAALPLRIPATMRAERAVLAGRALEAAATAEGDAEKKIAERMRADVPKLAAMFLNDPDTIRAARGTIAYMAPEIGAYAQGLPAPEREALERRWLAAGAAIAADDQASTDARLWAAAVPLAWYKAKAGDAAKTAPVPAEIKQGIVAAAALADQRATSDYDRHAVVSGAAALLRQVGEFDAARKLLDKELTRTDTPWYYQSSYASVERAAGNDEAALAWAKKARESVKGRASKLQWIVEDLALTAKIPAKGQGERVRELARDYYETATSLPDGFAGRNALRAKRVADVLKPFLKQAELRGVVQGYAKKCVTTGCAEHFSALLTGV